MQINRKTIIIIGVIIIIIAVGLIILFPKKQEVPGSGSKDASSTFFNVGLPSPSELPFNAPASSVQIDENNEPSISNAEKAEYEPNKRDSRRISNVSLMAAVLMSYVDESGNYPFYPIASTWVNLGNKSGAVYNTLKQIAQNAGVAMPKVFDVIDPLAPGYYYAYRSLDGKTCEISIRLEAKGEVQQGLCSKLITDKCVYVYKVIRPENISPTAPTGGQS